MKLFFDDLDAQVSQKYAWVPVVVIVSVIALIFGYTQNFFGLGIDFVLLILVGVGTSGIVFCIQALARIESKLEDLRQNHD